MNILERDFRKQRTCSGKFKEPEEVRQCCFCAKLSFFSFLAIENICHSAKLDVFCKRWKQHEFPNLSRKRFVQVHIAEVYWSEVRVGVALLVRFVEVALVFLSCFLVYLIFFFFAFAHMQNCEICQKALFEFPIGGNVSPLNLAIIGCVTEAKWSHFTCGAKEKLEIWPQRPMYFAGFPWGGGTFPGGVDFSPYLVDGLWRGGCKAKVSSSLNHGLPKSKECHRKFSTWFLWTRSEGWGTAEKIRGKELSKNFSISWISWRKRGAQTKGPLKPLNWRGNHDTVF